MSLPPIELTKQGSAPFHHQRERERERSGFDTEHKRLCWTTCAWIIFFPSCTRGINHKINDEMSNHNTRSAAYPAATASCPPRAVTQRTHLRQSINDWTTWKAGRYGGGATQREGAELLFEPVCLNTLLPATQDAWRNESRPTTECMSKIHTGYSVCATIQ